MNRSCGVVLVAVHNKDRTECKTWVNMTSHLDIGRLRVFKATFMPVQIISLYFSHWPFDMGLYTDVLLVAIRKLCMCDTI